MKNWHRAHNENNIIPFSPCTALSFTIFSPGATKTQNKKRISFSPASVIIIQQPCSNLIGRRPLQNHVVCTLFLQSPHAHWTSLWRKFAVLQAKLIEMDLPADSECSTATAAVDWIQLTSNLISDAWALLLMESRAETSLICKFCMSWTRRNINCGKLAAHWHVPAGTTLLL